VTKAALEWFLVEDKQMLALNLHLIYIAFIVCENSVNFFQVELQFGLVVPIFCDTFASVRTDSQK
jgi:hypothetical protein